MDVIRATVGECLERDGGRGREGKIREREGKKRRNYLLSAEDACSYKRNLAYFRPELSVPAKQNKELKESKLYIPTKPGKSGSETGKKHVL